MFLRGLSDIRRHEVPGSACARWRALLIKKRMEARGTPISDEFAGQLAAEAEKALRDRLQNGGKKMPPFRHLRGDEPRLAASQADQSGGELSLQTGSLPSAPRSNSGKSRALSKLR